MPKQLMRKPDLKNDSVKHLTALYSRACQAVERELADLRAEAIRRNAIIWTAQQEAKSVSNTHNQVVIEENGI